MTNKSPYWKPYGCGIFYDVFYRQLSKQICNKTSAPVLLTSMTIEVKTNKQLDQQHLSKVLNDFFGSNHQWNYKIISPMALQLTEEEEIQLRFNQLNPDYANRLQDAKAGGLEDGIEVFQFQYNGTILHVVHSNIENKLTVIASNEIAGTNIDLDLTPLFDLSNKHLMLDLFSFIQSYLELGDITATNKPINNFNLTAPNSFKPIPTPAANISWMLHLVNHKNRKVLFENVKLKSYHGQPLITKGRDGTFGQEYFSSSPVGQNILAESFSDKIHDIVKRRI